MRRRHPALEPSAWAGSTGSRLRVLVEHHDSTIGLAIGNLLMAEGYDVSNCAGPDDRGRRRCSLTAGEGCSLGSEADVIVFGLNISDEDDRAVLEAWRREHPGIPVVVEIPVSRIPLYQEELEGCVPVAQPMTREGLLAALEQAFAGAR